MCFVSWSLCPGMLKGAQVHAKVFQCPERVAVRMMLKKLGCEVIIDQDLLKVWVIEFLTHIIGFSLSLCPVIKIFSIMQFSLKGDQEWIHWSTWREVDGQPLGQIMGQDHGGNKHKLTAVLHCRLLQARKRQDNIVPLYSMLHVHTKGMISWFVQLPDTPLKQLIPGYKHIIISVLIRVLIILIFYYFPPISWRRLVLYKCLVSWLIWAKHINNNNERGKW